MSQLPPNPHDPPRVSWVAPIVLGALATLALHALVLTTQLAWVLVCCTVGCSGAPVGVLPALLVQRRDPHLGVASGFAVSFISVGLAGVILAAIAFSSWDPSAPELVEFTDEMQARLVRDGMPEDQAVEMAETMKESSRFLPVLAAGVMALMGGVAGALVAVIAGRRRPPPPDAYWPPTPGSAPPPA